MSWNAGARTKLEVMVLRDTGTITTGDGKDYQAFPWQLGEIVAAYMMLRTLGTTSGLTSIMLNKTFEDGTAAADILSSVLSIAYDASDKFTRLDMGDVSDKQLRRGDELRLDVDAIPGGSDSAGLHVHVLVRVQASNP